MKQVSLNMQNLLKSETVNFCWCIKLTRKDGVSWGFTNHDQDLVVDGFKYEAEAAVTPSAVENTGSPSVDNLSIEGGLRSDWITEEDLSAGRYDGARIDVYKADWRHPEAGVITMGRYFLSKVSWTEAGYKADLLSLKEAIQRTTGLLVDERCNASFGDARCGIDVDALEISASITERSSDGSKLHTDAEDGPYAYGTVRVSGGKWDGIEREIKSSEDGVLTLWVPMPEPLAVDQEIIIRPGCDKTFRRCKALENAVNFRGMPHVPGLDAIHKTPNVKM